LNFFPVTKEDLILKAKKPSLASHMGHHETILIIDDVREQMEIATGILKKLDYTPVAMSSGEAAVTYLKNHCADLLILDMIMEPGMDGLETYEKIIEIHPGQKALIVSGYAENNRVKTLQALGAGPYIKKPYTIEKLGQAIKDELLRQPVS